jgi:predicted alpha-1,2-mannosidase
MIKPIRCLLLATIAQIGVSFAQPGECDYRGDLVDLANPLMGTLSTVGLSHGNTYPAIATPWGMNFWSPQTGKMGNGWMYSYDNFQLRGFKQTHQPSPWINDYGQFVIMPVVGSTRFSEEDRKSWFSHKTEEARPYYYKVYLADYDTWTEIAPTERSASFRITYPESDSAFVVVDALDRGSWIKIIPGERKIVGYTTRNSGGVPVNFRNYFVVVFDKPFSIARTFVNRILSAKTEQEDDHVGAIVGFATRQGEQVNARVASSFISLEQAELNLRRENSGKSFDEIKNLAKNAWEKEFQRIRVEGGTLDQLRTFYSCLYRVLLFPRKFYEIDANNRVVHYSPYNGEVRPGYMFTDNGFWDTFRAVFPFFTLMYPELDAQILEGLANTYKESGWLPEWASPGHRNCMIGSNSASIIADAYIKGIRGFDINTLYEAVLKNSENPGPLTSMGRAGVKYYNELGYVPYDVNINENAARTLEYAHADYNIMKLAKLLNRPKAEVDRFAQRAQNYRNVFDPKTKFMRGRNKDGSFQSPFNPFKWGDAFTEGNSWHYTWCVFHDIEGLASLMGGKEAFALKLDSLFTVPPIFDDSYYGGVIHEIREMQIMGFGNYAHGNQPIQHGIYLYNYVGQPWKAQYWVHQVMDRLYSATPDGYCGDEDNGQTSAWYVFSAMGFYPVCPGQPMYVLGSPLFSKVTMSLQNGKEFVIQASNASSRNIYINSARLNGKPFDMNYINHSTIQEGGVLSLEMADTPNRKRGTSVEAFPPSMSIER